MARTLAGNLTGYAAVMQRRDEIDWLRELANADRRKWRDTLYAKIDELKAADPKWETWYDDDRNIPPTFKFNQQEISPILARINTRILHLQIRDEQPHL